MQMEPITKVIGSMINNTDMVPNPSQMGLNTKESMSRARNKEHGKRIAQGNLMASVTSSSLQRLSCGGEAALRSS